MNKIEKNIVEEMKILHSEIMNSLRMSLKKGIRIGELLNEQKEKLKHGEFTAWVNNNLPFTDRTARNYMRLFQERDKLKTETVSGLRDAYHLIAHKKKAEIEENWVLLWKEVNVLTENFSEISKKWISSQNSHECIPRLYKFSLIAEEMGALWNQFEFERSEGERFLRERMKQTMKDHNLPYKPIEMSKVKKLFESMSEEEIHKVISQTELSYPEVKHIDKKMILTLRRIMELHNDIEALKSLQN